MRVELGEDAAELVAQMDRAHDAIDQWQYVLDNLRQAMRDLAGDAEEIGFRGELIARTSLVRNRGKFDRARLHKDYPEIHDTYWLEGVGMSPRFTWRPTTSGRVAFK